MGESLFWLKFLEDGIMAGVMAGGAGKGLGGHGNKHQAWCSKSRKLRAELEGR